MNLELARIAELEEELTELSEIIGEAFNAGFKSALTKVKPEMRYLEVLTVKVNAWIEFVNSKFHVFRCPLPTAPLPTAPLPTAPLPTAPLPTAH